MGQVYKHVKELGGNEAFVEALKTKSQRQFAREWGLNPNHIFNYIRDCIRGGDSTGLFQEIYYSVPEMVDHLSAQAGKSKKKRMTESEARELW